MGVRFPTIGSTVISNSVIGNAGAEGAVCILPPFNITLDFAQIFLFWYFVASTGTATTAYTMRLRRGSGATGALVNVASFVTESAGVNVSLSGCYQDTPGAVAGQQYSLTCTPSGATAAGAVLDVALLAVAL